MRRMKVIASILCGFIFCILFSNNSYADSGSISKKWYVAQYYNCVIEAINTPIDRANSGNVAKAVFGSNVTKPLASYGFMGQDVDNCQNIYIKYVLPANYKDTTFSQLEDTTNMLTSTGYEVDDQTEVKFTVHGRKTIRRVDVFTGRELSSASYNVGSEDIVAYVDFDNGSGGGRGRRFYKREGSNWGNEINLELEPGQLIIYPEGFSKNDAVVVTLYSDPDKTLDELQRALQSKYFGGGPGVCEDTECSVMMYTSYQFDASDMLDIGGGSEFIYPSDRASAALGSVQAFAGYRSLSDLTLSENEKVELYTYYINKVVPVDLKNRFNCDDVESENGGEADPVHLKGTDGKWHVYYVNLSVVNLSETVRTLENGSVVDITIKEVIDWMNGHPADADEEDCIEPENVQQNIGYYQGGQSSEGDPSERCYEAAGVMGHILCPILSAISQFTDAIYNYVENNFLMINASEMTGAEVRSAWGIVRDVANVAFVIVLLLVIFSQVTGIGIDNYGIKRILPRLIVTAVLVNVSFLICQVFVDISNILGVNIKEFLGSAIPLKAGVIGNSGGAAGILGTVAAGGILTAVAFLNPGIILSLVTGIIGVVIALLFMFVILIARQIGVVLLIVLSPVAFICYMLPNTEKLFASWRKIFIALLMAYPICSLAMGGGTMVANILANTGDVSGNAVLLIGAMIVNVLPFFFIPTILKRSMAGLGNLGATLSGLGKSLGRGATGAMRNSTGYKALQGASAERKNRIKAGLDKEGNLTKIGKIKAGIADSKFGKSIGYGKLQKARISSAEKTITEQALGTGQLVDNAVAERYQNEVNAIKTQTVRSNLVNNLGDEGDYDWATADSRSMYYDENGKLKNTMAAQLYQYALDGNETGMAAITEQLSEKGHHGQEAVRQVMSQLQKDQASNPNAGRSIQSIAKTIMNNGKMAADYKSGARSSYDYMTKAAAGEGMVNGNFETNINDLTKNVIKASNYSQESFAKMDNEELVRISKALNSGVISGKDANTIRELAATALDNDLLTGGTKGKNAKVMNQIAGRSIEPGVVRGDGEGI